MTSLCTSGWFFCLFKVSLDLEEWLLKMGLGAVVGEGKTSFVGIVSLTYTHLG